MTTLDTASIADDLERRGRALQRLAEEMLAQAAVMRGGETRTTSDIENDAALLTIAKAAYDDRRNRARIFSADLFGEPGWDILLDLFIQGQVGRRVSVTAACIGVQVATSTALRYLKLLMSEGLVEREGDSHDGRRSWVRLTPHAMELFSEYLRDQTYLGRARPDGKSRRGS